MINICLSLSQSISSNMIDALFACLFQIPYAAAAKMHNECQAGRDTFQEKNKSKHTGIQ